MDTNLGFFSPGADLLGATTGGVERMRVDATGNIGIGITTPSARLHVEGKIAATGPSPSVASCGTGASMAGGSSDVRGSVTTGSTTVPACTINFSSPFNTTPFCVVGWAGTPPIGYTVSVNIVSTTQLTLGFVGGGGVTSASVSYICMQ